MKKVLKLLGILVLLVLLAVAAIVGTCAVKWPPSFPDTPKPAITASTDPAVIERGSYLFNSVAHCAACHQPMADYVSSKPGEIKPPKGGHEWHMGPLGTLRSANITPHPATGVGNRTDAELARTIRHGVMADGRPALFMFGVGPMSDDDLTALVSYIRSIAPVDNAIAPHEVGLLGKVLFQGPMKFFAMPHDYANITPPFVKEGGASAERGRYLAEGPGWCGGCHSDFTMDDDGLKFVGQVLSGAADNPFPDETEEGMVFYTPNLTPDPDTGHITAWTEEQFTKRMLGGRVYAGSPMPWESYANLTTDDVKSIWLYLRSLPPTKKLIGTVRRKDGEKP